MAVESTEPTHPTTCTWSRSPAHVSVGGRTCTVANLREVGDPATLGTLALRGVGVGFKLLTLYSLLAASESWGGGQSLKPLIYFSSCVSVTLV